jgi:hypothetical protein
MVDSPRDSVFTIAASGTTSNAIQVGPESIVGIVMPTDAATVGTAISFEGSFDNSTFYPILHDGTAVTVDVQTAASIVTLPVEYLHGPYWIRIVSNDTEDDEAVFTPVWRRFF